MYGLFLSIAFSLQKTNKLSIASKKIGKSGKSITGIRICDPRIMRVIIGIKICKILLLIKEKILSPIISGIRNTINMKRKRLNKLEKYYNEIVNNLNKLICELGFR